MQPPFCQSFANDELQKKTHQTRKQKTNISKNNKED